MQFHAKQRRVVGAIILATDPGVGGATVARMEGGELKAWSWGGEAEFLGLAEFMKLSAVDYKVIWFLEHPPKTTGRGRPESTGFVLGENYGFIKGVVQASGIRLHLIRPQEWQAGITGIKGKEYKERKNLIWEEAKRLFPAPAHVTKKNADAWMILHHAVTSNKYDNK